MERSKRYNAKRRRKSIRFLDYSETFGIINYFEDNAILITSCCIQAF